MLKDRIEDSLTFDDVLLLPGHSKLLPSEVSVKSRIIQTLGCNIPLLSATVDTVIEHQTAICMTKEAGIGSFGVIKEGGKDRYFQYHIEEEIKFVPEGIEGLLPYTGHLADSIYQFVCGLHAGMEYKGSATIYELRTKTRFVKNTDAVLRESHVHDIFIAEESPHNPTNVKS